MSLYYSFHKPSLHHVTFGTYVFLNQNVLSAYIKEYQTKHYFGIGYVNEYPTMHYFGNPGHIYSTKAYMILTEYFLKFQIYCTAGMLLTGPIHRHTQLTIAYKIFTEYCVVGIVLLDNC